MKLLIEIPDGVIVRSVNVAAYKDSGPHRSELMYAANILEMDGVVLQKTTKQLLIDIGKVNITADLRQLLAEIVRKLP